MLDANTFSKQHCIRSLHAVAQAEWTVQLVTGMVWYGTVWYDEV